MLSEAELTRRGIDSSTACSDLVTEALRPLSVAPSRKPAKKSDFPDSHQREREPMNVQILRASPPPRFIVRWDAVITVIVAAAVAFCLGMALM